MTKLFQTTKSAGQLAISDRLAAANYTAADVLPSASRQSITEAGGHF